MLAPWYGLLGPANLPRSMVDKWHGDVVKFVATPVLRDESAKMAKIIKAADVKVE